MVHSFFYFFFSQRHSTSIHYNFIYSLINHDVVIISNSFIIHLYLYMCVPFSYFIQTLLKTQYTCIVSPCHIHISCILYDTRTCGGNSSVWIFVQYQLHNDQTNVNQIFMLFLRVQNQVFFMRLYNMNNNNKNH